MKTSRLQLALLALLAACSNENTAGLRNSTATQVAGGSGNVQKANAQNSTVTQVSGGSGNAQTVNAVKSAATQGQTGFGNLESANLLNSSVTQTQEGIGNRQSIDLVDSESAKMHQTGIGEQQRFVFPKCGKLNLNKIQMTQTGILNSQTMRIGGKDCPDEKR